MKEFLFLYENDFDYFKYQWTLLKKHMKLLRNRKRRSLDFFYYFILFYDQYFFHSFFNEIYKQFNSLFCTLFGYKIISNQCLLFHYSFINFKSFCIIQIPDNQDGSQWFHLLNEEFTEKLLKGLNKRIRRSDFNILVSFHRIEQ